MRGLTLVWLGLAAAVGAGLFYLKYEVQRLEVEVAALDKAIKADREAIHVLTAEWSYLNQPQRLRKLVRRGFDLKPVTAARVRQLSELPLRFDAAGSGTPKTAYRRPRASRTGR